MYEKTVLSALKQYHIHIQTQNALNNTRVNSNFIEHISSCEEFIEQGNKVTASWMKENHTVISKSVKYAHDYIHRNYTKSDSEYLSDEHKELNLCVRFFIEYYEQSGIDRSYMDIDF